MVYRSVVDEVCLYDHGLSHNITYKRDQLLMKCVYMIMVSHTILLTVVDESDQLLISC